MNKSLKRATLLGIYGNLLLFILKIVVGLLYRSIAVISDAVNSLTDIVSSIIVYISVKVSSKSADKGHPFGHYRAEPIAGLIVAILIGIVGFEIINISFSRLFEGSRLIISPVPIIVMVITVVLKLGMYLYTSSVGKKMKSTAILASAVDHRNDILVSGAALIGIGGSMIGYPFLDSFAALIIGLWIIKAGYDVGVKNIKYLIGEAPSEELMKLIRKKAVLVNGVKSVHDIRAHYVGVVVQVEVHIVVDKKITIDKAHAIGKKVSNSVERMEDIDKAFVHIDSRPKKWASSI